MTDTPDKKRRQLTDAEHYKAMGLLHDHLRGPVAGLWTYADGFSDQKVADTLSGGVTLANIAGLRKRAFGDLSKGDAISDPRLELLIAAHDQFVRDVMGVLTRLDGVIVFDPAPYLVGDQS